MKITKKNPETVVLETCNIQKGTAQHGLLGELEVPDAQEPTGLRTSQQNWSTRGGKERQKQTTTSKTASGTCWKSQKA